MSGKDGRTAEAAGAARLVGRFRSDQNRNRRNAGSVPRVEVTQTHAVAYATAGAGTLAVARAAKNYSPIGTVACRFDAFCMPAVRLLVRPLCLPLSLRPGAASAAIVSLSKAATRGDLFSS